MPRVSIGLPVYNGSRYLRECLDSLVRQTFRDIEIVICDNASTDGTEGICRDLAARDPRIRYYRNDSNLGAGRNYNMTFELSRGEFFKWAAHDDLCAPRFIEACVERLDREPDAVLAFPQMVDIDERGQEIGVRNISHIPRAARGASRSPQRRFRDLIRTDYTVEEIFGVIRADILRGSVLIKNYTDSDRTLLAQLGLFGCCVEVPEKLFLHRMHEGMSTRTHANWQERTAWFDPSRAGRPVLPLMTQFREYCAVIYRAPVSLYSKAWCYFWMLNWLRRRGSEMVAEIRYARDVRKRASAEAST
jgi:glycosyltransferase involved in cell wall biosynthesis